MKGEVRILNFEVGRKSEKLEVRSVNKRITVEEMLPLREERTLFDVRTPAEFGKGHIPGAVNLPLFSNEERTEVGTLYKQESQEAALLRGLDFVGVKMRGLVEEAKRQAPALKVMVHCWRGGQRSGSLGWLLDLAGFDVQTMQGGYKAYRRYIQRAFAERRLRLLILGGHTGSGKTEILQQLRALGEQIIDLERIARHKGSAFGSLGEAGQPTVEQFENDLFEKFRDLDPGRRVWLENESRAIGRVYIPEGLWKQMNQASLLHLEVPRQVRVTRLVDDYAQYDKAGLIDAFSRIRKRLGGQHLQTALSALEQDDYQTAATIALRYYDKAYEYFVERRQQGTQASVYRLEMEKNDPEKAAQALIELAEKNDL